MSFLVGCRGDQGNQIENKKTYGGNTSQPSRTHVQLWAYYSVLNFEKAVDYSGPLASPESITEAKRQLWLLWRNTGVAFFNDVPRDKFMLKALELVVNRHGNYLTTNFYRSEDRIQAEGLRQAIEMLLGEYCEEALAYIMDVVGEPSDHECPFTGSAIPPAQRLEIYQEVFDWYLKCNGKLSWDANHRCFVAADSGRLQKILQKYQPGSVTSPPTGAASATFKPATVPANKP